MKNLIPIFCIVTLAFISSCSESTNRNISPRKKDDPTQGGVTGLDSEVTKVLLGAFNSPTSKKTPIKGEKRVIEAEFDEKQTISFKLVFNRSEIFCRFNHTKFQLTEEITDVIDSDKYMLKIIKTPLEARFTGSGSREVEDACIDALEKGAAIVVSEDETSLSEHVKSNADLFLNLINELVEACRQGGTLRGGSLCEEAEVITQTGSFDLGGKDITIFNFDIKVGETLSRYVFQFDRSFFSWPLLAKMEQPWLLTSEEKGMISSFEIVSWDFPVEE